MDPFASDGALSQLQNAFYGGQFKTAKEFDVSTLEPEHQLAGRAIVLRAAIADGDSAAVLKQIEKSSDKGTADLGAIKALAQYSKGDKATALKSIEALAASDADNSTVQVVGGTILQSEGQSEEALSLLSKHQGNLEAVALITHIHLEQNRTDLAQKEVQAAKSWAQDSLIINVAESLLNLRQGGEKYQQAFYVFEELAQAEATSAPKNLVGQAVAELLLGRLEESEVAFKQALEKEPNDADALANLVVLETISGKDSKEDLAKLQKVSPNHPLLTGIKEKQDAFDQAASKYSAKVSG